MTPPPPGSADARVAELAEEYFRVYCTARPFAASVFGVDGVDTEVPDPSRTADDRLRRRLAALSEQLDTVDVAALGGDARVSHAVLSRTLRDEQAALTHALSEVAVSATMMGAFASVIAAVPATPVTSPTRAEAYLTRLSRLGGYFDQLSARYRAAAADGRHPTARGVAQTVAQLDGYLATPLVRDPLLRPQPPSPVDLERWRARAGEVVESVVRPAVARYRRTLADELAPLGRDDARAGVCHVPGGPAGYLARVAAHTTTTLSPEEIHEIGLRLVGELREEFAQRGGRAWGARDADEVRRRLREDPALRFARADQIVATAQGALDRAIEALPDAFRRYDLAPCEVREMDPVEAENSVLGYYQPPAGDGARPGAHVVNTYRPESRPRYEYEVLAFHESVPGHHLQIAIGQSLRDLPDFRRFGYVTAYSEGWALYTERLADGLGLYSDELSRLGMVSFDAWRASRLVVDTGMHLRGWSRERAIEFMREHTALSESNIANEVDRYLANPGQALAYMIGRLRIRQLRDRVQAALGSRFDLREFHHQVLSRGALPLDTLDELVTAPPP